MVLGYCYWWKQHEFPWQVTHGTWKHSQDLAILYFCLQTAAITKIRAWHEISQWESFSLKFFTIYSQCRKIYSLLSEEGVNKSDATDNCVGALWNAWEAGAKCSRQLYLIINNTKIHSSNVLNYFQAFICHYWTGLEGDCLIAVPLGPSWKWDEYLISLSFRVMF